MGKVVIGWEIRGFNPKIGTNIVDTVEATVIIKVKSRKGRFIMDTTMSNVYLKILAEELVPATGCTEPIALAYAAAIVKDTLGENPERMVIEVSGNIIKNVKSVVVPNTGGAKGIEAAVAVGVIAGQRQKKLQVISCVDPSLHGEIWAYMKNTPMEVTCAQTPLMLDIQITGFANNHSAMVRIVNHHTNVVQIQKDDVYLQNTSVSAEAEDNLQDKSCLNVAEIIEFANFVPIEELKPILSRQIEYNQAISKEGLQGDWGANVGKILLQDFGNDVRNKAKAYAAAGSDARMSGCEMPVIILSGSGNQGMTASLPLLAYAEELGSSEEQLLRALAVSDLVTIHQKTGIGRLSAFCGAVSAGVGAGAGIAYLCDGSFEAIAHTVANALGMISGTICDGAKPSCAAKIASAVEAGILGYHMYCSKKEFRRGEGIIGSSVDDTIKNIGILAKQGMQETDQVILKIMTEKCEG